MIAYGKPTVTAKDAMNHVAKLAKEIYNEPVPDEPGFHSQAEKFGYGVFKYFMSAGILRSEVVTDNKQENLNV